MSELNRVLDPRQEAHPWLKRFKTARHGKWRLRSSRLLWDLSDLCSFLMSIERWSEVGAIGDVLTEEAKFCNDFDLWAPIRCALGQAAYAKDQMGLVEARNRLCAAALAPSKKHLTRESVEREIRDVRELLDRVGAAKTAFDRLCLVTAIRYLSVELMEVHLQYPGSHLYDERWIRECITVALRKLAPLFERRRWQPVE